MASQKDMIKLSEVVIDLLAQNMTDEKIIMSLQQYGLDETSAKSVLEKAKKEFDKSLSERMDAVIDRKLSEFAEQKLNDIKRDFAMHEDFKFMEQKEYTDRSAEAQKREIDSLKADLVSLTLQEETDSRKLKDRMSLLQMSGVTQKLLAFGLMVMALFSMTVLVYFIYGIYGYLTGGQITDLNKVLNISISDANLLVYMILSVVLVVVAAISIRTGLRIYALGQRQFEKVGLEFIQEKRKKEEGSIQELVKDKDVI